MRRKVSPSFVRSLSFGDCSLLSADENIKRVVIQASGTLTIREFFQLLSSEKISNQSVNSVGVWKFRYEMRVLSTFPFYCLGYHRILSVSLGAVISEAVGI